MPAKDLPSEMMRRGFKWKRTKQGGLYQGIELAGSTEFEGQNEPAW